MAPAPPRVARWRRWLWTAEAMALLCVARGLIALVPFSCWRQSLGRQVGPHDLEESERDPAMARRFAAHVERAAARLPFTVLCLPQAMALAWMLHRRKLRYMLTIASRPMAQRTGSDDLHAWVAVGDVVILGNLPGPWISVLQLAR